MVSSLFSVGVVTYIPIGNATASLLSLITYIPVGNATASLLSLITYIPVGNSRAIGKFRNAEIDYFGSKLIDHDFCRGSLGIGRN